MSGYTWYARVEGGHLTWLDGGPPAINTTGELISEHIIEELLAAKRRATRAISACR